jgi:hypothetical protein
VNEVYSVWKAIREQMIRFGNQFPALVHTVRAVLLIELRGSMAKLLKHVISTVVEKLPLVVFKRAFEIFSAGQTTRPSHKFTHYSYNSCKFKLNIQTLFETREH